MTAKKLIAKLKKFDSDMPVFFFGMDGDWESVSNVVTAKWTKPSLILRGLTTQQHLRKAIKSGRLS